MNDLAITLGTHALPFFFAALFLVLAAAAGGWQLLHRLVLPRLQGWLPPALFLVALAASGFVAVVAAAAGFAAIAGRIGAEFRIGRFDELLSQAIAAHVAPATLQGFRMVTRLGDVATLTALCIVVALWLIWRGRRWMALGWVIALAGNGLLNQTLKHVFERVRPVHLHGIEFADGFSFPSGHSSGSAVAYGMLAYVVLRRAPPRWHLPIVLAAAALAFTIGCSRVFLQVHYPSDVAAGLLSGSTWLLVCVVSVELLRRYRARRKGPPTGLPEGPPAVD